MSDTREKLINWLLHSGCDPEACESCEFHEKDIIACLRKDAGIKADHLIANGVRLETKQATETSDEKTSDEKTSDEKTSEWIPVSERLPDKEFWEHNTLYPDEDLEVAVMIKGAKGATALLYNAEGEFYAMDNGRETFYIVTHWMPLPEPPKGE